jgi:dihydrofolate synthase/folylpolyglutamate synthase
LLSRWQDASTKKDVEASIFASPMQALHAAIQNATPADRIVVFGSFYTVGGVLQEGVPRLQAQHLNS